MSFKESFKKARLKSGLSQEKAGNAIHRTRNAIKGYEEGISSPNPDQLVILCRLFNTTPNDLLGFLSTAEEDAKMCKAEICEKTIAAIKLDVTNLRKDLSEIPINYSDRRDQIKKSIIYAEEIIEDLENMEIQS